MRAALRAVASDDNQTFDLILMKSSNRFYPSFFRFEFRASGTAEHRPASLEDPADIS
jgi:hypothetical protein